MNDQTPEESQNQGLTDAEYHFREACKIFEREAVRLRQEQQAIDSMSKKLEQVNFSSTVKLNVGGHYFTTSVQTLTKDPNSMLAAMFSGKFGMKAAEDGAFFIDRDGTHFRFILNYLRTGKLTLPAGATFLEELQEEAEFYQIQGIIDELSCFKPADQARKPLGPFQESEILTDEKHRRILEDWLPLKDEWRLLFRASQDGFATETFHSKCDNIGPTVTIVKSANNMIFGGFTEVSWRKLVSASSRSSIGQGDFQPASWAFLFSMVNPVGLEPRKMRMFRNQHNAICFDGKIGPSFGGGSDLRILGNANMSRSSYSRLGNTYECPPGQQKSFFTGSEKFVVTNYEVFGLCIC